MVLYDAERRDGTKLGVSRIFHRTGGFSDVTPPEWTKLKRGLWGVARPTRTDTGTTATLLRILEDAPFYTRSEIRGTLLGADAHGVHESLDLDRFSRRWVQILLPFRMPRIARR
jgi:carotenoid 1,2-hydratase